ncbi:helix-turn-helix transcriptional regulator [Streptomyces sp. NPDC006798]|uniref:helix-turn-helix domain-containing protein n=1 Tax=Streptomyces sp. NPDC006798 TaxID=3155462 RepID=UPI00340F2B44
MFIGKALRTLREAQRMSQREISEALLVEQSTVSRWENNECRPNVESLIKLAAMFHVSLEDLVEGHVS